EGRVSLENDVNIQISPVVTSVWLEGDYGVTNPNHLGVTFEETWPDADILDPATGAVVQRGFLDRIVAAVEAAIPEIDAGYAQRYDWLPPLPDPNAQWVPVGPHRLTFYHAVDSAFAPNAASLAVNPAGDNNDILIMAGTTGPNLNGVNVIFINTSGLGDNANVTFTPGPGLPPVGGTLTIEVDPAATTAATVIAAINGGGTFGATLDSTNDPTNNGLGFMLIAGNVGSTFGGINGVPSFTHWQGAYEPLSAHGIALTSDADIPFAADDRWQLIADKIADTINNAAINLPDFDAFATVAGNLITLDFVTSATADWPLQTAGEGPGGSITGMAWVGGRLYAVSDGGGLYEVVNPWSPGLSPYPNLPPPPPPVDPPDRLQAAGGGARLRYIQSSEDILTGIRFSGLTTGPPTVEGGRYANTLFATDTSGTLYAFDVNGAPQPIFLDGATSVDLGAGGVTGVAFSTLDSNLWHVTINRENDPGHGVNTTFTHSRTNVNGYGIGGGRSFYFGREGAWNYDAPGGAHGTLTSETFSLVGYDPQDQPTLYFDYFLDSENTAYFDSARVYASTDGANWDLLASNTDRDDPFVRGSLDLIDGGGWRQARIGLAGYAGLEDIRLRFDFSTASNLEIGDANPQMYQGFWTGSWMPDAEFLSGAYLMAVSGQEIADGDTFSIDGQLFEFDMGYGVFVPNVAGWAIPDGEWFTVEDQNGTIVIFEFDNPDDPNWELDVAFGDVTINIDHGDSTADVAAKIATAVNTSGLVGVFADIHDDRIMLQGAVHVTQSPG
ncbi:MAG TPA: hypothetical protein VM243_03070, partial [Phycisphaerae bacterium]|nr:hypothetical protein [Phycisphaerae bacterium]